MKFPVCYIRVSSVAQASSDKYGLERQMDSCAQSLRSIKEGLEPSEAESKGLLEFIKKGNWTSGNTPHITEAGVRVYWDIQSGKDIGRLGFDSLVKAIEADEVSYFIIWHRNRVMRGSDKTEELEALGWEISKLLSTTLKWHNCELWEEGKKQVTDGMVGRVVSAIKTESEMSEASEREFKLRDGRRKAFMAGGHPCGSVSWWHCTEALKRNELMNLEGLDKRDALAKAIQLGYKNDGDLKKLHIDNGHVELFETIIEPYILSEENPSDSQVAEYLNEQGVPNASWRSRNPRQWTAASVVRLFSKLAQGEYSFKDADNDCYLRRPSEMEEELSVLPVEKCAKYLQILEHNKPRGYKPRGNRATDWLLDQNFLRCSVCGSSMRPVYGGRRKGEGDYYLFYYRCLERCKQGDRITIRKEEIETSFLNWIKLELWAGKLMTAYQEEIQKFESSEEPNRRKLNALRRRIVRVQDENLKIGQRVGKLSDQALEGAMRTLAANKERLDVMENDASELERLLKSGPSMPPADYFDWAKEQLQQLDDMKYEDKHAFIRQLIQWAVYYPKAGPDDAWTIQYRSVAPKLVMKKES